MTGTAQVTVGAGILKGIAGTLTTSVNSQQVDMYKIQITDPTAFSAIVSGSTLDGSSSELSDSELYLFDQNGNGLLANDDIGGSPYNLYSAFPAGSAANLAPGVYFIAVTNYKTFAYNQFNNLIFNTTADPTAVVGPNPNRTDVAVASWNVSPDRSDIGGYLVSLTGAEYADELPGPTNATPEPASLTLGALGALGLAAGYWRRRRTTVPTTRRGNASDHPHEPLVVWLESMAGARHTSAAELSPAFSDIFCKDSAVCCHFIIDRIN